GLGAWRVEATGDGPARVVAIDGASNGAGAASADDFTLHTDAASLARLAAGMSPLRLMLSRRLRLSGSLRRALALRGLSEDAGLPVPVDPDLAYRALAYAIDPEWTRCHSFKVAYELTGAGGGRWVVVVDDGSVRVEGGLSGNGAAPATDEVDGTVRTSVVT